MVPFSAALADKEFVIGQTYVFEEVGQRSLVSHNHYMATVDDSWASLPEGMEVDFPSPDHLRKKMLIEAGFCDQADFVFSTNKDAILAAGALAAADDYCVVTVEGRAVRRWTAKSQSYKAMGKETFQRSKEAVLNLIAAILERKDQAA